MSFVLGRITSLKRFQSNKSAQLQRDIILSKQRIINVLIRLRGFHTDRPLRYDTAQMTYMRSDDRSVSALAQSGKKLGYLPRMMQNLAYHKLKLFKNAGLLLAHFIAEYHLSRILRKPTFWFPTWSDTNQAVQLQKIARGLKFGI